MAENRIYGAEAGKALGDMLAANTVLRELDLSGQGANGYSSYSLDAACATELAVGLSANGALTSLDISNNKLCGIDEDGFGTYDASGVTALADAIGKHQ